MDRLGIEFLSVLGLPPVEFVNLAADLGVRHVSTVLNSLPDNQLGYPQWSLAADKALRREMIAVMRDRDVSISLGEGFLVLPGQDVCDRKGDLEVMLELGVRRINTVSMDPDLPRTFDQFALVAEMAADAGIDCNTEFAPGLSVIDLPTALAALKHVGRPNFRLTLDTMHLIRSGGTAADVAALDPDQIGYIQLADAPRAGTFPTYMEEAMYHRRPPGEGELPLLDILNAAPKHLVVSLEVPQLSKAKGGAGPHERVGHCVKAARELLARVAA
jgi:sugar phosphate isomerase/epimerase